MYYNRPTIDFKKPREFSDLIGATFSFIRQEFVRLSKALLLYAGPFVLLSFISLSYIISYIFRSVQNNEFFGDADIIYNMALPAMAFIFCMTLGNSMIITVLTSYISIYVKKGQSSITMDDVWINTKTVFFKSMGFIILRGFIISLGFLFFIIPGFYLQIALSLMIIAAIHENLGFSKAFSRSSNLIKDNWWITFALFYVVDMIISFVVQIFVIPPYIISIVFYFNGITGDTLKYTILFFSLLYLFFAMFIQALPQITASFHYFSQIEKKEGPSLFERLWGINKEEKPKEENYYDKWEES